MQATLFEQQCPSSAEYQETQETTAEIGHPRPALDLTLYCPSTRTAVLRSGFAVKGVRVRCKAKGCPVCGPVEWELHFAPVRATAEAGGTLHFLEVARNQREAFHKRVKRAGAEAKYVPFRDVFLCVTTLAEGRQIIADDLEELLYKAFEISGRVKGNVTGTRGWKKACEISDASGKNILNRRTTSEWELVGYAGMSPEKASRAVMELGEQVPELHVRETPTGWTTHCVDPRPVERLLCAARVLSPDVLAENRLRRQESLIAIARSREAA